MTVRDSCLVLKRFPSGEGDLIARCYCQKVGLKSLFLPEYFLYERYPLGSFEPFNTLRLYLTEINGLLIVEDIVSFTNRSLKVAKNIKRFSFLSKVGKTVLNFASEGDKELFKLLLESLEVIQHFEFNLIRFWLNFSTLLGFSVERISRPGWVNMLNLADCRKEELGSGYCVYISPKEFDVLKRISQRGTKPFYIPKRVLEGLERFFFRFLKFQSENF